MLLYYLASFDILGRHTIPIITFTLKIKTKKQLCAPIFKTVGIASVYFSDLPKRKQAFDLEECCSLQYFGNQRSHPIFLNLVHHCLVCKPQAPTMIMICF